mgnify:FL=1
MTRQAVGFFEKMKDKIKKLAGIPEKGNPAREILHKGGGALANCFLKEMQGKMAQRCKVLLRQNHQFKGKSP